METPPRIFLRPIGSPLTIGMSGLAIASLVESGVALKWVPSDEAVQAGLILVAVPFVLQLLATILSYLARDGAAGASIGVLATSWLALGLLHVTAGTTRTVAVLVVRAGRVLRARVRARESAAPDRAADAAARPGRAGGVGTDGRCRARARRASDDLTRLGPSGRLR